MAQHSLFLFSRRRRKEQEIGDLFEKMKENFLNLVKEIGMQVQEAQRVPIMMDANRPTPRHIIIKRPKVKDKERILKAARAKKLVTRWLPVGMGVGETGSRGEGTKKYKVVVTE